MGGVELSGPVEPPPHSGERKKGYYIGKGGGAGTTWTLLGPSVHLPLSLRSDTVALLSKKLLLA